jgi:hypothetical protein
MEAVFEHCIGPVREEFAEKDPPRPVSFVFREQERVLGLCPWITIETWAEIVEPALAALAAVTVRHQLTN